MLKSLILGGLIVAFFPSPQVNQHKTATFFDKSGALTTADISQGRRLVKYEDGGHFDCRRYTAAPPETARLRLAGARAFVWNHWQGKKRAYLRITFNSPDATSTSHIFIEPDVHGRWQVTWRIVRDTNEVNDVPALRTVERVVDSKKGYTLVFKSMDGKQVETL